MGHYRRELSDTRDPFSVEVDQVWRQLEAKQTVDVLDDPIGVVMPFALQHSTRLELIRSLSNGDFQIGPPSRGGLLERGTPARRK
jgi:hypothetical protein